VSISPEAANSASSPRSRSPADLPIRSFALGFLMYHVPTALANRRAVDGLFAEPRGLL
jgi:hypothetical protein